MVPLCYHYASTPTSVTMQICQIININHKGVTLTGRNHTGPPCSVGRPAAHAPGPAAADWHVPGPPAGSVTDDDRHQRAKQYWPI